MSRIVLGEPILRLCEVLLLTILLLHFMLWKVAILGTVCILTIPYYTVILAHSSRFGAVDDISHSSQSIKKLVGKEIYEKEMAGRWRPPFRNLKFSVIRWGCKQDVTATRPCFKTFLHSDFRIFSGVLENLKIDFCQNHLCICWMFPIKDPTSSKRNGWQPS